MPSRFRGRMLGLLCLMAWGCLASSGCKTFFLCPPPQPDVPGEGQKESFPPYIIQPPDILQIDAVRLVPLPPYKVEALDTLLIQFPADPGNIPQEDLTALLEAGKVIGGNFVVDPDGTVNLGPRYGKVSLIGLTLEKATEEVKKKVLLHNDKKLVERAKVIVDLVMSQGMQQIRGEHLVRPDGSVSLGTYGSVYVTGMTQDQAKAAVEAHLAQFLKDPKIALDVIGYNSMVYYVIFDNIGSDSVLRFPATGNETVLDALGQVSGMSAIGSRKRIWIARPDWNNPQHSRKLPVDWRAITREGQTATNYQVQPGDRIYVAADPLIWLDTIMGRIYAPIERTFGIILLGNGTIQNLQNGGTGGGFGVIAPF